MSGTTRFLLLVVAPAIAIILLMVSVMNKDSSSGTASQINGKVVGTQSTVLPSERTVLPISATPQPAPTYGSSWEGTTWLFGAPYKLLGSCPTCPKLVVVYGVTDSGITGRCPELVTLVMKDGREQTYRITDGHEACRVNTPVAHQSVGTPVLGWSQIRDDWVDWLYEGSQLWGGTGVIRRDWTGSWRRGDEVHVLWFEPGIFEWVKIRDLAPYTPCEDYTVKTGEVDLASWAKKNFTTEEVIRKDNNLPAGTSTVAPGTMLKICHDKGFDSYPIPKVPDGVPIRPTPTPMPTSVWQWR